MPPLTVITFKWRPGHGLPAKFHSRHVNVLAAMVRRHYPHPHRFVCVTDDPLGLDPSVKAVPLWSDHGKMVNPHGPAYPSCYRRLKLFSRDIGELLGERLVSLDLDCVITRDLSPLWNRPEDFVIWGATNPTTHYNASMILMTAGARPQVWEDFDPATSPKAAKAARQFGSDQGWISYRLGKGEAMWSAEHGVYAWQVHLKHGREPLPKNARVVFFNGKRHNPWDAEPQAHEWVRENWR